MESVFAVNYVVVVLGAVLSMVLGTIWYGPLFGKKWMEITGANALDIEERKKMQKAAGPLYAVQFVLSLFQVMVLSHFVADSMTSGAIERALWIWAAFVIPTLAGSVMWTNEPPKMKKARFLIQAGYQLALFIMFALVIQIWS